MRRERWFVYSLIFIKSEQLFIELTKILIYSTLELDKYWICQKISFHKFNFCLNRFLNIFLQFIIIQVEKICIILKTFYQYINLKVFSKIFLLPLDSIVNQFSIYISIFSIQRSV